MNQLHENLLDTNVIQDPYTYYRQLSEIDPVYWNEQWGGWILTKYEDVAAAFQDDRLSAERMVPPRTMSAEKTAKYASTYRVLASWMVFTDPPRHSRLRGIVNKAFTPKATALMEPNVIAITDELITQLEQQNQADILRDFANILPILVISDMLGLPAEDRKLIKEWSDDLMLLVFGALDVPDRHERAKRSLENMVDYLKAQIAERRKNPREDLITAILQASDNGDLLTDEEVISTCTLLVFGGHETTTNLLANGVMSLLQFPDQLNVFLTNQKTTETAVNEFLRFESPSKSQTRLAKEDLMIKNKQIKKGERLLLVQASANRDHEKFADPDKLDIMRNPNLHVAFGKGIHFCLGAPLARLEGTIAIRRLMERFPRMQLATEDLRWHETILNRGLKALPVHLDGV